MIAAPFSTSARVPTLAPEASNSASEMDACCPAPASTATSAPRAVNFLTVSGIAAQRVSPVASLSTAIFMNLFQDQEHDEADDEASDGTIFQHLNESRVVTYVDGDILRRRANQD